jgi:polysaccharide biosynthesis transport protein
MIPVVPSWRRQQPLVVVVAEPTSPAAESYRSLRTSLQFVRQEGKIRSIVVTSPGADEGKTATLANLGVVFAQGERVVLVSCDLRRPRIGAFFELDEEDGLTNVLLGQRRLEQVLLPVPGHDGLSLLPAGPIPPNPAELLNGARARNVFADLSKRFDLVLVDSPPMLPVTDAAILSQHVDATLMLAAAGQTRRGDLHRAVEKLDQAGTKVLGLVLNKVSRQTGRSYGYSYGYSYKPYRAAVSSMESAAAHSNGSHRAPDHSPR